MKWLKRLLGDMSQQASADTASVATPDTSAGISDAPPSVKSLSRAELQLLGLFCKPRRLEDVPRYQPWSDVLGEEPAATLRRLRGAGALRQATSCEVLETTQRVVDLKALLKTRGLPIGGKKGELIARLVAADPNVLTAGSLPRDLWIIADAARDTHDAECAREQERSRRAMEHSLEALRRNDCEGARQDLEQYDSGSLFPRGVMFSPSAADLQAYARLSPRILGEQSAATLSMLRIAAAYMDLWGVNEWPEMLPEPELANCQLGSSTAARMLIFHRSYLRDLRQMRDAGFIKLRISDAAADSCPACRSLAAKTYSVQHVPELPHSECQHELGCRCVLIIAE